ncbi:MAG: hypothetical protein HDS11_03000 [Bacteroides sp.]|nr:hypothetical protein [Bacteroides sp.]
MKASEVLSEIKQYDPTFSRSSLSRYVDKGYIKAKKLPSGRYNYDFKSVKKIIKVLKDNQTIEQKKIAYYSDTKKQKLPIDRENNLTVDNRKENILYFYDTNKTVAFKRKKGLKKLLIKILEGHVKTLIVPNENVFGSKKTKSLVNEICKANEVSIVVRGS